MEKYECPGILFEVYIDYMTRNRGNSEKQLYDLIHHTAECDDCLRKYKTFVDVIHRQNMERMRKRFPEFVDSLKEHQIRQLWERAEECVFNLHHQPADNHPQIHPDS